MTIIDSDVTEKLDNLDMASRSPKSFGLKLGFGLIVLLMAASLMPAQQIRKRMISLQGPESEGPAPGKFLVAPRQALDPNFANTVVLLVRYDETGALGLVINRPTKVPISKLFQDSKVARRLEDPAYAGGPVQEDAILALSRSEKKLDEAAQVIENVYLLSTRHSLDRMLSSKPSPNNLRVYLGYTGWGPGQLDHEMDLDVWLVLPGDADSIFDPDPKSVWPRLVDRTEVRFASLTH
jgi:putative transcriptional regulator